MTNIATFNSNQQAIAVSQQITEDHTVIENTIVLKYTFDRAAFRLASELANVGYYFDVNYCNLNCKDNLEWKARECFDNDTKSIYVVCLAAYNNGHLHGMWIDCEQEEDEILEDIEFMLSWSPVRHLEACEDWAIHDTNNWGNISISEYHDLGELSEFANAIAEHGKAYEVYLTEFDGNVDDFQDRYCGEYKSLEDYAYEYCEDTGMLDDVPDNIKMYFDYAAFGRDMDLGGDITFIDGHVFYCH